MVIDAREPQILERPGSERLGEAFDRDRGIERAVRDLFDQILELFV
jgi:hypothetical protein